MHRIRLSFLVLLAAAVAASAQEAGPVEIENRVAGEIREAEAAVERCRRIIAQKQADVNAASAPWEAAKAAYEKSRAARENAQADIAAFQGTLDAATAALDAKIETARAECDAARRQLDAHPNDSSARNEYIADAYLLESLYRRRDKVLEGMRAEGRLAALKRAAESTEDPYWRDYREYVHAASDYELQCHVQQSFETELAGAEERLALVRLAAIGKLEASTPPFLEKVVMRSDGKVVYSATWIPAADAVDERIDFMKKQIQFQHGEIRAQTERRDQWLDTYVAASDEVQVKIRAYESAIWWQCGKSIAIDLGDAAISIALDWEKMGPFAVAYQAIEKTADAVTGTMKGDFKKRYDLPASSGQAPPPFTGGSVQSWFTDAAIDRYKNAVKVLVEGAAGGELQALDHYGSATIGGRSFTVPSIKEADLWAIVKREAMEGGGEAMVVKRVVNPASLPAAWKTLRSAFRDVTVRELAGSLKQRLMTKDFWKEFGKGVAIDFAKDLAKSAAHDAARDERFAAWEEFLSADAYAIAVLRQLQLESNMLRSEMVQLKAYLKYLKELVDEKERVRNERRLKVETDEVAGKRKVDVEMTFSRDVAEVKGTLGGADLAASGSGKSWKGAAEVAGDAKTAVLSVDARDGLSGRPIDSDPSTIPAWGTDTKEWKDLDAGADARHRVKLSELQPGISIVLLVDCSGSMKDGGRMESAKAAVRKAIEEGALSPDDEVSLWAFFDRGQIRMLVPFTRDASRISQAVDGLAPKGATPLADAILAAGGYAVSQGQNRKKLLLVFSDGLESCGGNPAHSMNRVQDLGVEVR